jgi:hypothetical protein
VPLPDGDDTLVLIGCLFEELRPAVMLIKEPVDGCLKISDRTEDVRCKHCFVGVVKKRSMELSQGQETDVKCKVKTLAPGEPLVPRQHG